MREHCFYLAAPGDGPRRRVYIHVPPYRVNDPDLGIVFVVDTIHAEFGTSERMFLHRLGVVPHPTTFRTVGELILDREATDEESRAILRRAYFASGAYKMERAKRIATLLMRFAKTHPEIRGVGLYGSVALESPDAHDIDMVIFADDATVIRNILHRPEGRRTTAASCKDGEIHPWLIELFSLAPSEVGELEAIFRDGSVEGKVDFQVWANPMHPEIRQLYNEYWTDLSPAPKKLDDIGLFPERMASKLRLFNPKSGAFDPIAAHPFDFGLTRP